jgi:ParB family chromosome partitioning protein
MGSTDLGVKSVPCQTHHPKRQTSKAGTVFKSWQDQRRREETPEQSTGLRALSAMGDAAPIRLLKHDRLLVVEQPHAMLDEMKAAVSYR